MHYIAAHIEEISENGADVAHLNALHQPFVGAGGGVDFADRWLSKLLKHNWLAKWEPKPDSLRCVHTEPQWSTWGEGGPKGELL